MEKTTFKIKKEDEKRRLDLFLNACFPNLSRSFIKNLTLKDCVKVNDKSVKSGYALKENDVVEITIPAPVSTDIMPEKIPLNIIYEDQDLIVLNKAQGMVVHPSSGCYSGTLVNALLGCVSNLSGINGELRPGIVHRLDKNTSGVMLVAKNDNAHKSLAKQISEKSCIRKYICLVKGNVKKDEGEIITNIARSHTDRKKMAVCPPNEGKVAISTFRVLTRYDKHTLMEWTLKTGRTHQIRVHTKHIGHPVVADPVYGTPDEFGQKGQLLHSYYIKFTHPTSGKVMEFTAPLPQYFEEVLKKLEHTKI